MKVLITSVFLIIFFYHTNTNAKTAFSPQRIPIHKEISVQFKLRLVVLTFDKKINKNIRKNIFRTKHVQKTCRYESEKKKKICTYYTEYESF